MTRVQSRGKKLAGLWFLAGALGLSGCVSDLSDVVKGKRAISTPDPMKDLVLDSFNRCKGGATYTYNDSAEGGNSLSMLRKVGGFLPGEKGDAEQCATRWAGTVTTKYVYGFAGMGVQLPSLKQRLNPFSTVVLVVRGDGNQYRAKFRMEGQDAEKKYNDYGQRFICGDGSSDWLQVEIPIGKLTQEVDWGEKLGFDPESFLKMELQTYRRPLDAFQCDIGLAYIRDVSPDEGTPAANPGDLPPGTTPTESAKLVVDDFKNCDAAAPVSALGTGWYTYDDLSDGGSSQVALSRLPDGAEASTCAIRMGGEVTKQFEYSFAGIGVELGKDSLGKLSQASVVVLKVRGDGQDYRIKFRMTSQEAAIAAASTPEKKKDYFNDFGALFRCGDGTGAWTEVQIPLKKLEQEGGWGLPLELKPEEFGKVEIQTVAQPPTFQCDFGLVVFNGVKGTPATPQDPQPPVDGGDPPPVVGDPREIVIEDFAKCDSSQATIGSYWYTYDDKANQGGSTSRFQKTKGDAGPCSLVWSGSLAITESWAYPFAGLGMDLPTIKGKLNNQSKLVLKVRGDGGRYRAKFRLQNNMGYNDLGAGFSCGSQGAEADWTEVVLPMEAFLQDLKGEPSTGQPWPGHPAWDVYQPLLPDRFSKLEFQTLDRPAGGASPTMAFQCEIGLITLRDVNSPSDNLIVDDFVDCPKSQTAWELSNQGSVNAAVRLRKKGIFQGSCAAVWSTRARKDAAKTDFSTLATHLPPLAGKLGQDSTLVLAVRGSGRSVNARLLQPRGASSVAFQKAFSCGDKQDPDGWVEVQIPLRDMVQEDETLGPAPLQLPNQLELRTADELSKLFDSLCEVGLVYLKNAGEGQGPQAILPGGEPKLLVDDFRACDTLGSSLGSEWKAVYSGTSPDRYSEIGKLLEGYSQGTCSLLWTNTGADTSLELDLAALRAPLSTKLARKTLVLLTRGSGEKYSVRLSTKQDGAAEQVFSADESYFKCGDPADWGQWTRQRIDLAAFSLVAPDGSLLAPTPENPGPAFLWTDVQKLILYNNSYSAKTNACELGLVYFEQSAPPVVETAPLN